MGIKTISSTFLWISLFPLAEAWSYSINSPVHHVGYIYHTIPYDGDSCSTSCASWRIFHLFLAWLVVKREISNTFGGYNAILGKIRFNFHTTCHVSSPVLVSSPCFTLMVLRLKMRSLLMS